MTAGSRDPAAPAATEATPEDAVSEDRLLGGRVRLSQPVEGYRAAIDPVFLAAAVPARAGDSVLDLGCGVGAAALCLLARVPELRVTGLELQADLVRLAGENARANGAVVRVEGPHGDGDPFGEPQLPCPCRRPHWCACCGVCSSLSRRYRFRPLRRSVRSRQAFPIVAAASWRSGRGGT